MSTEHELKTWPAYYQAVARGTKMFEVRRNRGFQVGDVLHLREYEPNTGLGGAYTGSSMQVRVTFIVSAGDVVAQYALRTGYVVMGIERMGHGGT